MRVLPVYIRPCGACAAGGRVRGEALRIDSVVGGAVGEWYQ